MTHPSPGRIVHYALSAADADAVNRRRADYKAHRDTHAHPHEPGTAPNTGHVGHMGNFVQAGNYYPAMVVRWWQEQKLVNLQVHLDGNDLLWVTSVHEGEEPGTWTWPPLV